MAYALPRRVVRLDHVQRDDTPGMAGEKLWDIAVLGGGIVQEIEGEPVSALGLGLEGRPSLIAPQIMRRLASSIRRQR
jgi:hypothetical protein